MNAVLEQKALSVSPTWRHANASRLSEEMLVFFSPLI